MEARESIFERNLRNEHQCRITQVVRSLEKFSQKDELAA